MRREGHLVMMVWQEGRQNEWFTSIRMPSRGNGRHAGGDGSVLPRRSDHHGAGSRPAGFGGWRSPTCTCPSTTVRTSPRRRVGLSLLVCDRCAAATGRVFDGRARERLVQTLAAHATEDGVWFDSRAWVVAARRR
jgi:hypothetical protein